MTTQTTTPVTETATAAASGANATERFFADKQAGAARHSDRSASTRSPREVLAAVHDIIRKHQVTYDEYDALKAWLIRWARTASGRCSSTSGSSTSSKRSPTPHREGNKGTIEGPYYVPDAPDCTEPPLPMRDDEARHPADLDQGAVSSTDGTPLPDAKVEIWHADDAGFYAQFAPGIPEWNLRGAFGVGADGAFEIHTIQPAPYQIPTDGSCGKLIAAAGWHAWRPAHLHLKVSAPGHAAPDRAALLRRRRARRRRHRPGRQAGADARPQASRRRQRAPVVTYDFVLDPGRTEHAVRRPHGRRDPARPGPGPPGRDRWLGRRRTPRSCNRPASGGTSGGSSAQYANISIFDVDEQRGTTRAPQRTPAVPLHDHQGHPPGPTSLRDLAPAAQLRSCALSRAACRVRWSRSARLGADRAASA